jgi:hypothetical protein
MPVEFPMQRFSTQYFSAILSRLTLAIIAVVMLAQANDVASAETAKPRSNTWTTALAA